MLWAFLAPASQDLQQARVPMHLLEAVPSDLQARSLAESQCLHQVISQPTFQRPSHCKHRAELEGVDKVNVGSTLGWG